MKPWALAFGPSMLGMLLAGMVFAQTPAPKVVGWEPGAPNADFVVRNGRSYVTLRRDGLSVLVSLGTYDLWTIIHVSLTNASGRRVEVVPSRITFDLFEFRNGAQPERIPLVYQDPDRLAASVRHVSRWAYVGAAMAGMSTQQSTTRGTVTGDDGSTATIDATTTTRDQAAEDRAIDTIERNREGRAGVASDIQDHALRENTLVPYPDPNWTCAGDVYFTFPKHFNFKRFRKLKGDEMEDDITVPVGDYIFVFPFGKAAK